MTYSDILRGFEFVREKHLLSRVIIWLRMCDIWQTGWESQYYWKS